jgi:hypothetical protein
MDLTLTFESGTSLDLQSEPATFRTLAIELEEQGLRALADTVRAHARLVHIPDQDKVAAGRALGAVIAHL